MIDQSSNNRRCWCSALLFGAAFFLCAQLGRLLSVPNTTYVSFWLPAGLYVGVLLLNETRSWPLFMLAALAANLAFDLPSGTPFVTTLGLYCANTVEAVAGAWLTRRFAAPKPGLSTLGEFFGLVLCSPIIGGALGATAGAATLVLSGMSHSYWGSWMTWWTNEAMAILVLAPFLLVWFSKSGKEGEFARRGKLLEGALLGAALIATTWYLLVLDQGIDAPYKARLMPLLLWAGLRFGLRGAAAANLLFAVLVALLTTQFLKGLTPAEIASGSYVADMQSFLAISAFMTLVPTIVIHENKRKVEALRESEERFRRLTQAAFEGVCVSENGVIRDVNDQILKMFGYTREEMVGRPIMDMVAPESRASVAEAVRSGREGAYTHRLLRKDGRIFPAEAQAKTIQLGGRELRMTTVRDITERMRTEAALQLSDFSVTHASLPTLWIASDRRIFRANHAACALLGHTEAELLRLTMANLDPDHGDETWPTHWRELRERKHMCFETRLRRKDGRIVPIEADLNWFEFRGQEYGFAFMRDITERRSDSVLAKGQRHVLEMIAGDAPLNETLDALLRMVEIQAEDMLCSILLMDANGLQLRHAAAPRLPADYTQAINGVRVGPDSGSCGTAASRREPVFVADIAADPLWKDFASLALPHGLRACWSTPILDAQHNVLGTFAVYSRQPGLPGEKHLKLIELVSHTATIAISREVAKATLRETESLLRQAQKMEAIGQLAGGVAHDFNNILASILMQTDLLRMAGCPPEDLSEGLRQIHSDAERATNLTRQLLMFGRRQVLHTRVLDLNELVANLGKMLRRIIREDVRLELRLHPAPLPARADAGMIDQAIMNLAVNARDAMPGGGRLLIETGVANVDEEAARLNPEARPGRCVFIGVGDSGTGIQPELMPRIFEPFFTTKEVGKGTGLGLATVFGIVKQHQGWITVDSRPGEGTHFRMFFPASVGLRAESPDTTQIAKPPGGTETILLVEDDPAVRMLTRTILQRHGYRPLEAADGKEALKLWAEHRGDVALLLTDLVMPGGLGGHELARRLRVEEPGLKVIYVSGHSAEIAGRELNLGQREIFVQKPFATGQILEAIRRSLDG